MLNCNHNITQLHYGIDSSAKASQSFLLQIIFLSHFLSMFFIQLPLFIPAIYSHHLVTLVILQMFILRFDITLRLLYMCFPLLYFCGTSYVALLLYKTIPTYVIITYVP